MKVLYDHQLITWQKYGGISRYFYELMRNSKGLFEYDVSGIYCENEYVRQLRLHKEFPIKTSFKGKNRLIKYINRLNSKRKIKREKYDIIHPCSNDPYFLDIISKVPLSIAAYRDIYKKAPKFDYGSAIANESSLLEENITSQENIVTLQSSSQNFEKQDYILFTGQRRGYKNFDRFVEAVSPLLILYDIRLICTGYPFTKDESALLRKHKIDDRTISRFVPENELQDIYSGAILFVFPSLYEGFGFPILEAFASGCPVILSNTSCFPEIAEDAAVYFDPYSVLDIRQKIENVLLDVSLQSVVIKKGFEQVKKFSWRKTAEQTYQLYSRVLSLPANNKSHFVITVHDMIDEIFPEYSSSKNRTAFTKYILMRNADKIIAVSKNTKMDILKTYPEIDENKIDVIHHGTSFNVKG